MILRILQLNIYACTYFDNFKKFLTTHACDIYNFQEVCGKNTILGNIHCQSDNFSDLKTLFGKKYQSRIIKKTTFTSSNTSYMSNVTFVDVQYPIREQKIIWLRKIDKPFPSEEKDFSKMGSAALACKILVNNKPLWLINTHISWSPNSKDTPGKEHETSILADFLKDLTEPFILTGDFNADSSTQTIKTIEKYAVNLTEKYHIKNTLNTHLHRAQDLFPPGLAVDYIFVSPYVYVRDFHVVDDNISDHLGLIATVEF